MEKRNKLKITFEYENSFGMIVVLVSLIKASFISWTYRSTDFEVHRNWMAITNSLPLEKWYYEKTSEWTLDYPPLFAYFEWILAQLAKLFDPKMLELNNLNYSSNATIFYLKGSVIITDLLLALGIHLCAEALPNFTMFPPSQIWNKWVRSDHLNQKILFLVFTNGGLFIVDHIHFQYNGILFGLLFLSIAAILKDHHKLGFGIFLLLLNMKHIFIYMAPALGMFLLRQNILPRGATLTSFLKNSLIYLGITIGVFGSIWFPFIKHIPQVLQRLFPFQRGLTHAYWAPNVWAIYNTADLVISPIVGGPRSNVTSGLVGKTSFAIMPNIEPWFCLLLTVVALMPMIAKLWRDPSEKNLLYGLIVAAWTSFMFGYHVHEKAILNVVLLFGLIAGAEIRLWLLLSASSILSLFPLVFSPFDSGLKVLVAAFTILSSLTVFSFKMNLSRIDLGYLVLCLPVAFVDIFGHLLFSKFPFLPLIIVSVFSFLGVAATYCQFYYSFYMSNERGALAKSSFGKSSNGSRLKRN